MDVFRLDHCVINKIKRTVIFENKTLELSDKSIYLLFILAQAINKPVSRQYLLDTLWPDTIVSDDSLTNLVSVTRAQFKQLGLTNVIKTVPKKGYCLIGNIQPVENTPNILSTPAKKPLTFNLSSKYFFMIGLAIFVFMALISASNSDEELTLGILPVSIISDEAELSLSGEGLIQELHHTAATQNTMSVLSRSQVYKAWQQQSELKSLNEKLNADYVLESQIRPQGEYLRVTMQWVNARTSETNTTGAYDVRTELLKSDYSKIWRDLSELFIQESLYALGIHEQSKAESAIALCSSYEQHFTLYKDGFLKNVELIAEKGLQMCELGAQLASDNKEAFINYIQVLSLLIRSDLKSSETQKFYFEKFSDAIDKLALLPRTELAVAEARLLYNIVQVAEYARKIDLSALYKESEALIQVFENSDNISTTFANRAGVIRQRYVSYLLKQGENPDDIIEKAHKIVDAGLALEPNHKDLLHTKANVYFRLAWTLKQRGEDPTLAYSNAIAFFKNSLIHGDDRAVTYDSIASNYANLVRWQVEQGLPFEKNAQAAALAYEQAFKKSQTNFRSRNNAADFYNALMLAESNQRQQFEEYFAKGMELARAALTIKPDYPYPNLVLSQLNWLKAKADLAENNGSIVAATECAHYFRQGAQLMPSRANLLAALAYCQVVLTEIHLQQNRMDDAHIALRALLATNNQILELEQTSFESIWALAETSVLKASWAIMSGNKAVAKTDIKKAISRFNSAMKKIDNNRDVMAGLIKALLIEQILFDNKKDSAQFKKLYTRFHALFPNDGRLPILDSILQSGLPQTLPVQLNDESFVQYMQKSSLFYGLKPFFVTN